MAQSIRTFLLGLVKALLTSCFKIWTSRARALETLERTDGETIQKDGASGAEDEEKMTCG